VGRGRVVDLIFEDGYRSGWTVRSPGVPGLIAARADFDGLFADLPELLASAGVELSTARLRVHFDRHVSVGGADVVIRVAGDDHRDRREHTAGRIMAALIGPDRREQLLAVPRTFTGEVLYVCVVPTDTVDWVTGQLSGDGDAAAVAMSVGESLWTAHFTDRARGSASMRVLSEA